MTVLDRPEPPRNIHGSEFAGEALTLNWSAPFEDGGAPITNYVIERFVNNHTYCQDGRRFHSEKDLFKG